jgi:hypothetical protein
MVRHLHERGGRRPSYNWGFLLLLGMAVEFWIILTTIVAQNL